MTTVLIVDDDKFTRTVLQTAFTQDPAFADMHLRTITASNGREGFKAYRKHRPEVVITDLLMPEVDGFTLCRKIRDEPAGLIVHLIAMSGIYRDLGVVQRMQKEFDAEFFAKPYQLRDLTRHVATLLEMDARGEDSRSFKLPLSPMALRVSSGELAERPLPAVLFDLLEAKASGHLSLKRGRVKKVVELVVGHPSSVSSTARDDSLGHFLVSFGVITDEQHKNAVKRAAETKEKVSDALISLRYLTPEEMVNRLTMQTCHKLIQSLRWPDGAWRFEPQEEMRAGPRGNPIDMVALVLQGLKQTASADPTAERIAEIDNKTLSLTPRGQALVPAVRQYLSSRFAEAFIEGATVASLLAEGVERTELYMTLEALLLVEGLVSFDLSPDEGVPVLGADESTSGDFSVGELSEISHTRRILRPPQDGELYSMLFDDVAAVPAESGELPIQLPDDDDELDVIDSGIIDVAVLHKRLSGKPTPEEQNFARRMLLKEYLRIQGLDHYAVLRIDSDTAKKDIAEALSERQSKMSLDWFARFELGRDYAKLEEIQAAYERAGSVLLDDEKRAAYDRSRAGADGPDSKEPALDAEISYHAGQDLLQHGSYEGAIDHLRTAVAAAPDEADYHAALGWAFYLKGGRSPEAADAARPHLNQGLAINPDHAPSHEYKGVISAALGSDEAEAIFHLERALDADPSRSRALETLETLRSKRGELRALERQYRRMVYRSAGNDPALELELWLKLAELYRGQLGETENARIAYESAARLAPEDGRIRVALANLGGGTQGQPFTKRAEALRGAWRRDPLVPDPGLELMRMALDEDRPDAAFLAASALIARHSGDREAERIYERYRPRFVMRAHATMDPQRWEHLRHENDRPELGALFELLAPVVEASFPLTPYDLEVDTSMEVSEEDLPDSFQRIRAYVAHFLGVDTPRVFVRPDFGHQIHVGAVRPPLLLAGDDALTSPERLELSFRLGRAMTYLMPGRTFAGSRPARLLKAAVLAVFRLDNPEVEIYDPEGYVAQLQANLGALHPGALADAQRLVYQITQTHPSLNLSRWARALARTADRVGLLLCGDLPAAVRFARDSNSSEAIDDLIDYALSDRFWTVRSQVGLSIDV